MGQVQRRQFLIAAGALLTAPLARARETAKVQTLGILASSSSPTREQIAQSPFMRRLKELGWVEGHNLVVVRAFSGGQDDRMHDLAAELVKKHVDVIWAIGRPATVAAARATKKIPIVFWGTPYPVEMGIVESLARPGRNATGISFGGTADLAAKQMEFLREISPRATRLAWFATSEPITVSGDKFTEPLSVVDSAAKKLGFELRRYRVLKAEDLNTTFTAILESRAEVIGITGTPLVFAELQRIVEFVNRNRLPSASISREFVEAGGLISYGANVLASMLQSLGYVDRILLGAKAADLPVELPTKFELVVNLKTAKAIGITVPKSLLIRADEVIQ